MRAVYVGGDVGSMQQAAARLRAEADALDGHSSALTAALGAVDWVGDGAAQFLQYWGGRHRINLASTSQFFREAADTLGRNAIEQADVSAANSHLIGRAPIASVDRAAADAGMRIPAGSHAATSDYISEITRLGPGEMALRPVGGGPPPRYVLMLRGLDVPSSGTNDLGTTMEDFVGSDSEYQRAIRSVLADVPNDAVIGIVAHSQGGIAAVEVAQGDPRIRDILTLGSPIDARRVAAGVNLLSVENIADPIPWTDEAMSYGPDGGTDRVRFHNESGFSRLQIYRPARHALEGNYLEFVEHLEGDNPDGTTRLGDVEPARRWLSDFEAGYGGDGGSGPTTIPARGSGGW